MEFFLVGKFQMYPGLVIWTGPSSEISNECEIGAPHGVCVGNFQSDPFSVMWRDLKLEIPNEPKLGYGIRILVEYFE